MRVLALSYFYPPIGGAGVQRNLRLTTHLSELGVELTVVTGAAKSESRWSPHDASLAASTSPEIKVRRIQEPEPSMTPLRARLERLARVESEWSRWWNRGAIAEGARVGRDVDLVWALMQPYASTRPAAELASQLRVPWVADLADPWALDEMLVYPSALHRRLAMREMRHALASAAGIVMSTTEAASRLVSSFPELAGRPVIVGPVGWDVEDFSAPVTPRSDPVFRVVHTGYLHTDLGRKQRSRERVRRWLGGARDGVDILTRSHVYLVQAIDALLERRPELHGRLEVWLAGVQTAADHDVAGGREYIRMLGYVDHSSAVDLMRSADLLFLPMHELSPGIRASIVPGKTYEYIASGRPILAAVPEGDARDILREAGTADVCGPSEVRRMTEILERRVDGFLANEPPPVPAGDVAERYEYGHLARELERFFDRLVLEASVAR
jgi:hypothetical protein